MPKLSTLAAAATLPLLLAGPAAASGLDVKVLDQSGKPVESAVVSLTAPAGAPPGPPLPAQAIIDQNFETFFPLVTILPTGGSVTFRNSDKTMHQVYSFSTIKRFAFEVDVGHSSPAVVFDKPGTAAIGCNIHDQMITYVVVTDNPYTKLSDKSGAAHFTDLQPGHYAAEVWHPDLAPGANPASAEADVGPGETELRVALRIVPRRMAPMSHMGAY
ncbi:MAG TPA: methylamine utilization protein [Alphaproteobacteria bacterium]|nr:methylamine utilization protein [Alphaproteobacteria bacterium]